MRRRRVLFIAALMLLANVAACTSGNDEEKTPETMSVVSHAGGTLGGNNGAIYECNAEDVLKAGIVKEPIVDLTEKTADEAFMAELKETLKMSSEEENNVLYGKKGCYISTKGIGQYNIAENASADAVNCYIFSEEKEVIGELMFYVYDEKLQYQIVFFESTNPEVYFKTLSKLPEKEYIVLTNGYKQTYIDEENTVTDLDFDIEGDVFGALNYKFLRVSYNDILEQMVWVEFE